MGKIQEALEKVKAEREGLSKRQNDSASVIAARHIAGGGSNAEHAVVGGAAAGKSLEVCRDALREAGMVAPEADEQMLEKQYQSIKRPLIAHAFGKRVTTVEDGNIIMITSSLAGEGKTFSSVNLALSMAQEKDHSVLLVDADVAKPHISELFGAAGEPGLLDLLEDPNLSLKSILLPTDVAGLTIVPAGKPRPYATELLASARMEDIVSALGSYRQTGLVLLDSPPLLQTNEANVLATLAGQIVVVVKAEQTARDSVLTAISLLHEDKPVNLILNEARWKQHSGYYSYGAGRNFHTKKNEYPPVGNDQNMWGH